MSCKCVEAAPTSHFPDLRSVVEGAGQNLGAQRGVRAKTNRTEQGVQAGSRPGGNRRSYKGIDRIDLLSFSLFDLLGVKT